MRTHPGRSTPRRRIVATALVLVASAACGGGDDAAAPEDIRYEDAPDEIEAGEHVFELVNDGSLPHDVTIEELDGRTVVSTSGGGTATGEVELEPGTYTYYCSVGNHRQQGMEGTLEVTE